jgi:hypothetical protein
MTTKPENCFLAQDEAADVLHSANGLLESVASLSQELAGGSEESEISWIKKMITQRGFLLEELMEYQPTIREAVKVAGRNSPEFQHFSDLTKKIRKCDDILVEALQKRKNTVEGYLESAQNSVKLQSYAR